MALATIKNTPLSRVKSFSLLVEWSSNWAKKGWRSFLRKVDYRSRAKALVLSVSRRTKEPNYLLILHSHPNCQTSMPKECRLNETNVLLKYRWKLVSNSRLIVFLLSLRHRHIYMLILEGLMLTQNLVMLWSAFAPARATLRGGGKRDTSHKIWTCSLARHCQRVACRVPEWVPPLTPLRSRYGFEERLLCVGTVQPVRRRTLFPRTKAPPLGKLLRFPEPVTAQRLRWLTVVVKRGES